MYQLTANDKLPLVLFGKTYWWSVGDDGKLYLISNDKLLAAQKVLADAARGLAHA